MTIGTKPKPAKTKEKSQTYAEKRREEKRAALREYLMGHNYLQDIHADLEKDITEDQLPVIKFKTETRLKLLAKCLPDLARVENTGEDGGPLQMLIQRVELVALSK